MPTLSIQLTWYASQEDANAERNLQRGNTTATVSDNWLVRDIHTAVDGAVSVHVQEHRYSLDYQDWQWNWA
ncbi:hypothetical protein Lepto7375DRAFT_0042 [Leptolyngbya sp. PCC 7375]|nr:hypothetical protein Lepto7375DRAFT_0042 [Leptolyngbya sp. PCC 7375]